MKKHILIAAIALLAFSGCSKDDEVGGTATQDIAGEWWVQISVDNTPVVPDFFKILTYNTAENVPDKMWLDDEGNLWPFKFKVNVNASAKTFSAEDAASTYSNITINLMNGKILKNASKGPLSKAQTDSIYFEAEFSDDPGIVYQLSGYKRTRFSEDDHN